MPDNQNQKICPLMSGPSINGPDEPALVYCVERDCQHWITVFTTEQLRCEGCAHALAPEMHDGLLRV